MPSPSTSPRISKQSAIFTRVEGLFHRAIDPCYRAYAIAGSRTAGRYSANNQPTLYLSSTVEGVGAAMIAHASNRSTGLKTVAVQVRADRIFDMRNPDARRAADIAIEDALSPWQDFVSMGGKPPSWTVRERVEQLGGFGLIDPSRKAPGLWHLVLFVWNSRNAPDVRLME